MTPSPLPSASTFPTLHSSPARCGRTAAARPALRRRVLLCAAAGGGGVPAGCGGWDGGCVSAPGGRRCWHVPCSAVCAQLASLPTMLICQPVPAALRGGAHLADCAPWSSGFGAQPWAECTAACLRWRQPWPAGCAPGARQAVRAPLGLRGRRPAWGGVTPAGRLCPGRQAGRACPRLVLCVCGGLPEMASTPVGRLCPGCQAGRAARHC